ncbi:unnamed protein product [Lepeophtheirus salmonis]|uniref:(salmon louse) hypothetical protein n=1 Tax=Lepeophtheirus salmonis TaxID=72036 RepID=A0A7R8D4B5_LEPSM|nr:unnamed protein product [Lepeophtheirus salmonis]CAF2994076.1 unnamed protein product [Lepeophtheirus salmonis]
MSDITVISSLKWNDQEDKMIKSLPIEPIKVEDKTKSFDASVKRYASECNGKTLENIINENETNILVNTARDSKDNGCEEERNSSKVEPSFTPSKWVKNFRKRLLHLRTRRMSNCK